MKSAIRFIRHARILPGLAVAALAMPLVALAGTTAASARPASGAASGSDAVPHYQHIVVIMFTDHSYSNILGNQHAPTFNRLARNYGLATRYYTTSYSVDAAGLMASWAAVYGVNDGSPYWDQPISKLTQLSELDQAHRSCRNTCRTCRIPVTSATAIRRPAEETDSLYKQEKF